MNLAQARLDTLIRLHLPGKHDQKSHAPKKKAGVGGGGKFATQEEWEAWVNENPKIKGAIHGWQDMADDIRAAERRQANGLKEGSQAQLFNEALERAPDYEGDVYRGLWFNDRAEMVDAFGDPRKITGKEMEFLPHSSASKDFDVAHDFANHLYTGNGPDDVAVGVMLKIKTRTGADISNISSETYKYQREVVLGRNTKYSVKNAISRGVDESTWNEVFYMELEEVG